VALSLVGLWGEINQTQNTAKAATSLPGICYPVRRARRSRRLGDTILGRCGCAVAQISSGRQATARTPELRLTICRYQARAWRLSLRALAPGRRYETILARAAVNSLSAKKWAL
jgi:hypothetical protein